MSTSILAPPSPTTNGTKPERTRGTGRVYERPGSKWLWLQWYARGRMHRESAKTTDLKLAEKKLRKRLSLADKGDDSTALRKAEGITFEDLMKGLVQHYQDEHQRSLKMLGVYLDEKGKVQFTGGRCGHLRDFFGGDRAHEITRARIKEYRRLRLKKGAALGTVNRETAALQTAFSVAIADDVLSSGPAFHKLDNRSEKAFIRKVFIEDAEHQAAHAYLLAKGLHDYADVLEFYYWLGWRGGAIKALKWTDINLTEQVIHPDGSTSTKRKGTVNYSTIPALQDLIERREAKRVDGLPWVFHYEGRSIGDWRKTWKAAFKAAGCPDKRLHDYRRTAVRNLVWAGIPQKVAMAITGHSTVAVFNRYDIGDQQDLKAAGQALAAFHAKKSSTPPKPGGRKVARRRINAA